MVEEGGGGEGGEGAAAVADQRRPPSSSVGHAAIRVTVIGCCPLWRRGRTQRGVRGSGGRRTCQPVCHWLSSVGGRSLAQSWRAAVGVQRSAVGEVRQAAVHVWRVGGLTGRLWLRLQTLFGTSVGVVKHRVSSPQHHVHALTHGHRLQHLHHLFMRATQHAAVIDVDQDVRCVECRRSSRCDAVHLQKLSGSTSSHDVEAETSRTFREPSVDGVTLQLAGLLCELWEFCTGSRLFALSSRIQPAGRL